MIPLCHCAKPGGSMDVQSIISDYFVDQDPRVRTAALKAMVRQSLVLNQHPIGVFVHLTEAFIRFSLSYTSSGMRET